MRIHTRNERMKLTFEFSSSLLAVVLLNKPYASAVGDETAAMDATRARR